MSHPIMDSRLDDLHASLGRALSLARILTHSCGDSAVDGVDVMALADVLEEELTEVHATLEGLMGLDEAHGEDEGA